MLTNKTFYVGEARLLSFYPERNKGRITPDSATIQIQDSDGVDVVAEVAAGITGDQVYYLISESDVTAEAGSYVVYWTYWYGTEKIETRSYVIVQELFA